MEKYVPDMYQKSIYTIDYDKLLKRGIKCILFDLDNTIVPINVKEPNEKIKKLFDDLKEMGYTLIIFSNSTKRRVEPFRVYLDVDSYAFTSKPFSKNFIKVLNNYHFKEDEVAIIGDQMLTDIAGGNKIGITTILVNPVSTKDPIFTKINRLRERHIMFELRNNNLFVKGRYYE